MAAITLAERVATEQQTSLGKKVGYHVRFDDTTNKGTQIKFLTNGMLIRETMGRKRLKNYSIIILDEAHERSLGTDILFGLLKNVQYTKKLKIIVMSATLEVEKFVNYFNCIPVLQIRGFIHRVTIRYLQESNSDLMDLIINSIKKIHLKYKQESGDVLVFLTGKEEILSTIEILKNVQRKDDRFLNLICLPFYSTLPLKLQKKIFKSTPYGKRKIILSTNIAETSITITGIKFIIDSGLVKKKYFNSHNGIEILKQKTISRSEAWQRSGRIGRKHSGIALRLYSEPEFDKWYENVKPEILRVDLSQTILQMKVLGIKNIFSFDFLDVPRKESIIQALKALVQLQAIDLNGELLPLGKKISQFPISPKFGRILVLAKEFGCSDEVLKIVTLLNLDASVFMQSNNSTKKDDSVKRFKSSYGDLLTLLNVWNQWQKALIKKEINKAWYEKHFLNEKILQAARFIHKQLTEIYKKNSKEIVSCRGNIDLLRKCLFRGFIHQLARLEPGKHHYNVFGKNLKAKIHPSSTLFQEKIEKSWIIFAELIYTTRLWLRNCLEVEEVWIRELKI